MENLHYCTRTARVHQTGYVHGGQVLLILALGTARFHVLFVMGSAFRKCLLVLAISMAGNATGKKIYCTGVERTESCRKHEIHYVLKCSGTLSGSGSSLRGPFFLSHTSSSFFFSFTDVHMVV
jgi:hypothetical protein